jgi:hypothetical protein
VTPVRKRNRIFAECIVMSKDLAERFGLDEKEIEAIMGLYTVRRL